MKYQVLFSLKNNEKIFKTVKELQIRRSNRDNSEIIFLVSQRKHIL